ncbi:MAG: hypothetical protein WBB19_03105 [Desulforhopalus sp.]
MQIAVISSEPAAIIIGCMQYQKERWSSEETLSYGKVELAGWSQGLRRRLISVTDR